MPKVKSVSSSNSSKGIRKPEILENVETQCVALALDLVRQRLIDGTASSQETTHFLKMASRESQLKLEMLELEKQLVAAKTDKIKSEERSEQMYQDAINAMRNYSGNGDPNEY